MEKAKTFIKKEAMLTLSVIAAIISLFITPPSRELLTSIDWKTLATLFMLLSVLDGFRNEDLFRPLINFAGKIKSQVALSFFLIFSVFFSSMFVTNDVSLIIFVPLTILLFKAGGKEQYTIPVLVMENIAAVRGSLLTPFGSPQNLFLYSKSGLKTGEFLLMMLPLWLMSIVLLSVFILVLHRKNLSEEVKASEPEEHNCGKPEKKKQVVYLLLFIVVLSTIVTRTALWPYITLFVALTLLIFDRKVFLRVDYALLGTFLCFFVFSSSLSANGEISAFLQKSVAGNEYLWSLILSQVISNVPASIVLWPFTTDLKALIYGLDTAGLVTIIGSLASVINIRLYTKEYPGNGLKFMKSFELISLAFFAVVVFAQLIFI
ncbi:MAG: SLC13 family permease [Clostridia bacterium]|nr:SLC13 family permease [Clostridia bacterium]